MKLKRIKNKVSFDLKSKKSKFVIPTEKDDPQLPSLFVFCGSRGSGKTYACTAMVAHFERKKYITRTFLICPTRESNTVFNNLKTLDEADTCEEDQHFQIALEQILQRIQEDWEHYEEEIKYTRVYKRYKQQKKPLSLKDLNILEEHNYTKPTIPKKPGHMLIIDDAQGTDLYSNNRKEDLTNHITIKHRHIPLSICFLVQSWTGLPRVIRLNATHFALYKTGDKRQLFQIYEAFGNIVSFEVFQQLYKQATRNPHDFLFIDTVPKEEYMRFRHNLNTYMLVENN